MALPKISLQVEANPTAAVKGLAQITKSLQKTDAATQEYEKGLMDLERAMKSGLLTDKKYATSLAAIEKEYRDTASAAAAMGGGVAKFNTAIQGSTKQTGAFVGALAGSRNQMRMTSMQLSQVAQQGSITGNYLQALAIQLPDLALGFGPIGIAAGAVGGALAMAFLPAIQDAWGETKTFEGALDDLKSAMEEMKQPLSVLSLSADELAEKYGVAADTVLRNAISQSELAAARASRAMVDQVSILDDVIKKYSILSREQLELNRQQMVSDADWSIAQSSWEAGLQRIADKFKISTDEAELLSDAMRGLGNASGADEISEQLSGILDILNEAGVPLKQIPVDLQRAINEMITLNEETALAKKTMEDLANAAASGPSVVSLINRDLINQALKDIDNAVVPDPNKKTGAGRAGVDQFARRLEQLQKSLMTEREVLETWYAESEILLNDARAKEYLTEAEHKDQMLRLEEEYQERLGGIKDAGRSADLQGMLGAGQQTLQALGSFNQKALKMAQVFGAAKAFIATFEGAAEALKLPFPANLAAAASVIAAGAGFVAAIKSVGSNGSTPGGVGAGGAGGAAGAAPQSQGPLVVKLSGISPTDMISGAMLDSVLDQLQDQAGDRGLQFAGGIA